MAGYPFYPQPGYPGMRGPYPTAVGPTGLPLTDYLATGGGLMGVPAGFAPQFPIVYGFPPQGNVKGGRGGGGGPVGYQGPQFQGQMPPAAFFTNSAPNSGPNTPTATNAQQQGAQAAAAVAGGFARGQPYPQQFVQMAYASQPYGAYPLAYQMAGMNLGGMPAQFLPLGQSSSSPGVYPSGGASSSVSLPASATPPLPAFPTPTGPAPFADLLASTPLTHGDAPYFSVDVECVATGPGHNDRALAHVAVVDQYGQCVLNVYIKPKVPVVSYLPALTGLSEKDLSAGVSEEEALAAFRATIPPSAVLVGQNILKDVEWLHLVEGQDFASMLDLAGLFAAKNPRFAGLTFFSLAHEAKALLCMDQKEQHHPAIDAYLSIKLYQLYTILEKNPIELERAKKVLLDLPVDSAFNRKNPVYDGVCMGNKRECKCGSPWFF